MGRSRQQQRSRPGKRLERARRRLAAGDLTSALRDAEKAVEEAPSADAYEVQGLALLKLSKPHEAFSAFQRMAVQDPARKESYLLMGRSLELMKATKQAAEAFAIAVELDPTDDLAGLKLARAQLKTQNLDAARERVQRMIDEGCREPEALALLGSCADAEGDRKTALGYYLQALELSPEHPRMTYVAVVAGGEFEPERLERLVRKNAGNAAALVDLHFALGLLYDRRKDYDEAFAHYIAANRAKDAHWDPDEFESLMQRVKATCTKEFFAEREDWGLHGPTPILIAGMPRSGTSLVEQILASHPRVKGFGEHGKISLLSRGINGGAYPEVLTELTAAHAAEIGRLYMETVPTPDGVISTDKALGNHIHLGMTAIALPDACIVQCTRDPLDSAVSAFCLSFDEGNLNYAYDLEHLGRAHASFLDVMEHWKRVLPRTILEIRLSSCHKPHGNQILNHSHGNTEYQKL